jgi:hypothetical protein
MKYVGCLFSKMAAYSVALLVAYSAATAQAQQQGKAVVRAIRGSAQYSQGGDWSNLSKDKELTAGAVIKTGADSQVDLTLDKNGKAVRIKENSILAIDTLTIEDGGTGEAVITTKLNLSSGRVLGEVVGLAAASKYEVKVPTGTIGIRGTKYDISVSGVLNLQEGTVVYTLTDGQQFTVNAGQTFTPPTAPNGQPTVTALTPEVVNYLQEQFTEMDGEGKTPFKSEPKLPTVPTAEPPVSPTTGLQQQSPNQE